MLPRCNRQQVAKGSPAVQRTHDYALLETYLTQINRELSWWLCVAIVLACAGTTSHMGLLRRRKARRLQGVKFLLHNILAMSSVTAKDW